jgi:hypothetical protein
LEHFPIIYLLWLLERAKLYFHQLEAEVGWLNQTPAENQLSLLSQQYGIGLAKMKQATSEETTWVSCCQPEGEVPGRGNARMQITYLLPPTPPPKSKICVAGCWFSMASYRVR